MVNWKPSSMFNSHSNNQDIGVDNNERSIDVDNAPLSSNQSREQESSHIDQTSHAEPQREPTSVFPSDFGGYILNPESRSNQSSDLVHGSDDMIAHKNRTTTGAVPPPGYATKPQPTHDEDVGFFGDSNTTEPFASSRSTLDQAGLHRGSISTLPSAGNQRRGSSNRRESLNNERSNSDNQKGASLSGLGGVHSPESATSTAANVNVPFGGSAMPADCKVSSSLPSNKLNAINEANKQSDNSLTGKNGLSGMASAVASGAAAVATGAAAVLLGTNNQHHSDSSEENDSKMPSAWPDASQQSVSGAQDTGYILENSVQKDATNCTHEPSIHGQNPCFYTKDDICEEKEDDTCSHCAHVQEPSIHGQNPSFYCEKQEFSPDTRNAIKSSVITGNDLTQPGSINPHPACTNQSSNYDGIHDSKGIDSDAITAGSSQTRAADAAAIGTAGAIGTGAGIAAFNREPIDADAIRRRSLDHQCNEMDRPAFASDNATQSKDSKAIPSIELTEPIKRTDLGDTTLDEGQVAKTPAAVATAQNQQSVDNNAVDDAVAGGGAGAVLGGLFGHRRSNSVRSNKSTGSHASSKISHKSRTPESNNINAVYQTSAQGVTPERSSSPNNIHDVYRTNAQGVISDEVSERSFTPTTAAYENDIRDVYRTNAQGATQNMITPGNPTVSYHTNDISDVYRTAPRNMTPQSSTPRYAESPRLGSSATHNTLLASGGIAAAVGGILGSQHSDDKERMAHDSAVANNQENSLHIDPLPLNHTVDQKPLSGTLIDNNSHPQQMHSIDDQASKNRANDSLHPQTGSAGPAPIIAGNTKTSDLPENLQQTSRGPANNALHPQTGSTGPAPIIAGNTKTSDLPGNLQHTSRGHANDELHPQTGSTDPAPIISGNTKTSDLPGNLQQTSRGHVNNGLHPQTGSTDPAPVITGPVPNQTQKLENEALAPTESTPIIAGSAGTGVPGNMARSKDSFSSTRAITGSIVPSPAAGAPAVAANGGTAAAVDTSAAIASRPDEVKDRAPDGQNAINNAEPKRKTSLTEGIKSAFRRLSLKSDNKPKESRRMSAAEAFKNQTLTATEKSNHGTGIAGVGNNATPAAPNHQSQQQQHPTGAFVKSYNENSAATGSNGQNYARIPDVHSLKPVGTVNVADNGEVNFVKLNEQAHAEAPTKSTLSAGKSEHRRGSIQNTVGKIIGNKNLQDKGMLSQVSGKEKINAYNAHTHPTNLSNF
ncbi:hypothetical protein [Parasitella parasitica]|uniref:Uncharacterized protein n=1 Tax=Parasitella parasitica TaxID=35722 RepID=A0A0B7N8P9_9FUNG|nr:hypothetical protein [Parasitella parasitica]